MRLAARYGAPVLAAGHTAVPNLVRHHWRALGATYGDFYLYLVVMERKRTAEHPRLHVAEIARAMGTHERQVRDHVARLQRLGLLLVRPSAGNRAAYDFSPLHARVVALDRQAKSAAATATHAPAHSVKHPPVAEENAPYRRNVPKTSSSTSMPPTPIDGSQAGNCVERTTTRRQEVTPPAIPRAALSAFPGPAGEEDDAELVSLVWSLSQEFGDPAPASNVTQARRHRQDAQMELADFVAALQEAARRTHERRHRLANPMGYLFTVLRDLLFNETAQPRVPTRHQAAPVRAPRRHHSTNGADAAGAYAPAHGPAQVDAAAVADDLWRAVLCDLAETMTPGNFETWLRETVVVARDERRLVVGTPSAFARDWLSQRLHGCVSRSLERLGHGAMAVEYVVCQTASLEAAESLAV